MTIMHGRYATLGDGDIVTASVRDFSRITGLGVTTIYALLNGAENEDHLQSISVGKKRLILMSSWYELVAKRLSRPNDKPAATPPRPGQSRKTG
jgi:hypothetical protein